MRGEMDMHVLYIYTVFFSYNDPRGGHATCTKLDVPVLDVDLGDAAGDDEGERVVAMRVSRGDDRVGGRVSGDDRVGRWVEG